MELIEATQAFLIATAQAFKGSARRRFMARTVAELGAGGPRRAERELGWNRGTLRQGAHELRSGITGLDACSARGRQRAEEPLPHRLDDRRAIVDSPSQTDPQFKSHRLDTRLSAAEGRRQWSRQKGYRDAELPVERTLSAKLSALGYHPTRVRKCQPLKK